MYLLLGKIVAVKKTFPIKEQNLGFFKKNYQHMLKWSADNIYFGEAFYSIWEIRKVEFRRFTSELYDWKLLSITSCG